MMTARRPPLSPAEAAPLLVAPELARHHALAQRVADLRADVAKYPPHAHRRLILETRLKEAVAEMLALEVRLFRRGA